LSLSLSLSLSHTHTSAHSYTRTRTHPMTNSPLEAFVSFMYQLIDFAFSVVELLFTQLLPTLALLVGASLQFLFDFLLSFWFPNRAPSSSISDFYPSDSISDDLYYMDADDGYYYHDTSRHFFDTNEEESRSPLQARRSRNAATPLREDLRRELFDTQYDNRQRDDYMTMLRTVPYDRQSRSTSTNGDHLGNADGLVRQARNNPSLHHLRGDLRASGMEREPRRHQMGLSQQSPSGSLYHSSPLSPSSSSPWIMLKRSIKKYASKLSVFLMSRIWAQRNNGTRQWNRPSLLQSAW
ncbi:hypothetical protein GOP47_0013057, partial [Adiantum capillus-veneris]